METQKKPTSKGCLIFTMILILLTFIAALKVSAQTQVDSTLRTPNTYGVGRDTYKINRIQLMKDANYAQECIDKEVKHIIGGSTVTLIGLTGLWYAYNRMEVPTKFSDGSNRRHYIHCRQKRNWVLIPSIVVTGAGIGYTAFRCGKLNSIKMILRPAEVGISYNY